MASKKTKSKPKRAAAPPPAPRLQNLAARPSQEDLLDEQLVDHSGVFRVTSAIAQAQTGHEDAAPSFASDSLVMAAQRDGFREAGPTPDDAVDDNLVEDETQRAGKRQRLATLAARAQQRRRR